jgi:hypothetical protein
MVTNAENQKLLVKGVQPKTDSGESLQDVCKEFNLEFCSNILQEKGYYQIGEE